LLVSAIRSLEILSVKKEPKLSARDVREEIEGNGHGSLRCRRLLTVCQRCLGLTEEEETKLDIFMSSQSSRILSSHFFSGLPLGRCPCL